MWSRESGSRWTVFADNLVLSVRYPEGPGFGCHHRQLVSCPGPPLPSV